jgi:transcriptional regulator with XRE-family HTH domain
MQTAKLTRKPAKKTLAASSISGSTEVVNKKVQPATEAKKQRQKEREELPLSQTLGQTIKAMRIKRNLSQEQLAGLIECDRSFIGLIEQGKANPTVFVLSVVAGVFSVTLSELLKSITVEMNLKPTWKDAKAVKRRANRSTPDRKKTPERRLR